MSSDGNGAVILTSPDPPVSLIEVSAQRAATSLGLTWSAGATDGGAAVLDYTITFDQATGTDVVLASGILGTTYTATGLTAGLTYRFKVQARNTFGLSTYSNAISLLCAFIPNKPALPTTIVSGD
jgi:titin